MEQIRPACWTGITCSECRKLIIVQWCYLCKNFCPAKWGSDICLVGVSKDTCCEISLGSCCSKHFWCLKNISQRRPIRVCKMNAPFPTCFWNAYILVLSYYTHCNYFFFLSLSACLLKVAEVKPLFKNLLPWTDDKPLMYFTLVACFQNLKATYLYENSVFFATGYNFICVSKSSFKP